MKKQLIFSMFAAAAVLPAAAHTVLLSEDFSTNDWQSKFTPIDLDHNAPHTSINAIFMSEGSMRPWHPLRDTTNGDRYMGSHSYYQKAGVSNDWLAGTQALTIPSTGFELTFGAQSLPMRSGEEHALSDLWVFVTEQPVTANWQPAASDAALHLEKISYGKDRDNCEGDFLPFSLNLDAYAGKTVYISFANLNEDKDLLCIDDVVVQRLDNAEMTAIAAEYVEHGAFDVTGTITGTGDGLKNWTLTFKSGDTTETKTGAALANGVTEEFSFTGQVGADASADWSVTLSGDNSQPIIVTGTTNGLTFMPTKRVLVEESTGVWCGNCPTALYLLEQMEQDPEIKDKFIPVSAHIGNDMMSVTQYEGMLGFQGVAPAARLDRDLTPIYFGSNDFVYDLNNPASAANKIKVASEKVAIADIALTAEYLTNAGKITGIDVTAEVTPAITIEGGRYAIGFILTENNVHLEDMRNSSWHQHNYLSKDNSLSDSHPWKSLPSTVPNVHFQDVARENYGFRGMSGSMPSRTVKADEKVSFNTSLALPDPYLTSSTGAVISPALNTENLYLTAYLYDTEAKTVINANRIALGENPEPRFTSWDLCKSLNISVDGIENDNTNVPAEYFTLQGVKVNTPAPGSIYIVRRGDKVTKEMVR